MPLFRRSLFPALLLLTAAMTPAACTDAASGLPEVGRPAPDFSLMTNEGRPASLQDHRGRWVVLYFYPMDFTSGCTLEAQSFQRDLPLYEQAGAVILGVSVDSVESHQSFCAQKGLSFQLLSDPGAQVSTRYGSIIEVDRGHRSARNTFIIDPGGRIARAFIGVEPAGHSEEVLRALSELQGR